VVNDVKQFSESGLCGGVLGRVREVQLGVDVWGFGGSLVLNRVCERAFILHRVCAD
jgi:hypothetical protein